jgi:hypothetical protein
MTSRARWYIDPVTRLPNIRRHPAAHEYQPPDEVKRMVAGRTLEPDMDTCPTCGQPIPTGTCDDN